MALRFGEHSRSHQVSETIESEIESPGEQSVRAMRARGFKGYGDLEMVDLPKPDVADGRVLVRMTAAGVTPLDHTILSGQFPKANPPLVLGNEGAGVVDGGG